MHDDVCHCGKSGLSVYLEFLAGFDLRVYGAMCRFRRRRALEIISDELKWTRGYERN